MQAIALMARTERKCAWEPGMQMSVAVLIESPHAFTFDLDGAMPCLIDAVLAGLSDRKNPPDQWITELVARKRKTPSVEQTFINVYTGECKWIRREGE